MYRKRAEARKRRAKAQGARCSNCGREYDWDNPRGVGAFTSDHVVPLAAGGSLHGKLVGLCGACNRRKGSSVTPTLRDAS